MQTLYTYSIFYRKALKLSYKATQAILHVIYVGMILRYIFIGKGIDHTNRLQMIIYKLSNLQVLML